VTVDFASFLRRVVFVGEAALRYALDFERGGRCDNGKPV
jgi:hypothetical protein